MINIQQLAALQQNPQLMQQLIDSPIDPNAILAYQMGGAMPEMPGVTMGQGGGPAAPQAAVPPAAKPPADIWSQMGSGAMSASAPAPGMRGGPSPMLRYGEAPAAKAGNFSSRGPQTRPNSLDDILAGFRK